MKNKKLHYLLLVVLFLTITASSYSQSVCNPAKQIRTNPSNPVNNETPSLTNHFNWTASSYAVRSLNYPSSTTTESPFYQSWNGNMTPFVNSKDMQPADGWEVIKMDFGYDQNNNPTTHVAYNPKLILYNRFNGILRVFIARGDNYSAYNNIQVVLKFKGSTFNTSALDLSQGVLPLDASYSTKLFETVMTISNTPYNWMYADFPIAYDPCTCFYSSLLHVDINYLVNSSITLQGSINGTLTAIANGSGNVNTPATNSLSFTDPVGAAKKFTKAYKDITGIYTDLGKNIQNDPFLSAATKTSMNGNLKSFTDALGGNKFLQGGLSALPYIGAAVSFLDFFSGGGRTSVPAQVQLTPTAIDMKANLSGSISNTFPVENFDFLTPGASLTGTDQSLYPLYNQTMGVFNLLHVPKLYLSSYSDVSEDLTVYYMQARFKDPIQYVLNPASGLTISSMQAALVIQFSSGCANGDYNFLNYEGTSSYQKNGTTRTAYQMRTNYVDTHCLNDQITNFTTSQSPYDQCPYDVSGYFLKILVDYQITGAGSNTQHILQVYKFPVSPYGPAYSSVSGPPNNCSTCQNEKPSNPSCSVNLFVPASNSDISTLCHSTVYTNARQQKIGQPQIGLASDSLIEADSKLIIYPNPSQNHIFAKLDLPVNEKCLFTIQNNLGINVHSATYNGVKGNNIFNINVENLKSGVYILNCLCNDVKYTKKFVVAR